MQNTIIVFDFETDHREAGTDKCNPVELAAVAIHSKKLEVVRGSEFSVFIKPDCIDDEDYYETHKDTIDWHCRKNKCTVEELLDKWREGMQEKKAWSMFRDYVNSYNYGKKDFTAPIPSGANIRGFDLPIYERLCAKYKMKPFFHKRDKIDAMELCLYWFSFAGDKPNNYKVDTLRDFFGMSAEHAHEALGDVKQEAEIITTFLRPFKKYSPKIDWRNSIVTGA